MLTNKCLPLIICLLLTICYLISCKEKPKQEQRRKTVDYIRPVPGTNDIIPAEIAQKGKVLISYADCYICHKEDETSAGPAFQDVAKRYPANKVFIEMLAQKVIAGGSGSWGTAMVDAHPKLSVEDARTMVSYILSMKKQ